VCDYTPFHSQNVSDLIQLTESKVRMITMVIPCYLKITILYNERIRTLGTYIHSG
jgi:hypothetical protein